MKKMTYSSSKMIDSIISEGSEFKGEFSITGNVKINGVFRGRIIADGKVIVGSSGIGICDIIAKEVVIGGEIRGNVLGTENIKVLSSGNLRGNIITSSIYMEEGVNFNGFCKIDHSMFKDKIYTLEDMLNIDISTTDDSIRPIVTINHNEEYNSSSTLEKVYSE
jgi:cytoskeletal protein CcmA (bactofilin family)